MRRKVSFGLFMVGIVAASLAMSFVITIFLTPLWRVIEARWGIEAIGNSGPATWCYVLIWGLLVMGALLAWWLAARRARKAAPPPLR